MMAFVLGQRADAIGKVQGLGEIAETKGSFEPGNVVGFRERPFGDLWFELLDIRLRDARRITPAGGAFFVG